MFVNVNLNNQRTWILVGKITCRTLYKNKNTFLKTERRKGKTSCWHRRRIIHGNLLTAMMPIRTEQNRKIGFSQRLRFRMMSYNYDVAAHNSKVDMTSSGTNHYKQTHKEQGRIACVWSEKANSLSEILNMATLPLIVKFGSDTKVSDKETPVDLRQPLLLYKEIRSKRLHARNLKSRPAIRDVGQVVYKSIGPTISIPENFTGFFKHIDSKDQPLFGIAEVSRLMSKSFISIQPCNGYVCVIQLKETVYQKMALPPGLYHSNSILEGSITYINKRKCEKRKLVRCLSCEDEKSRTVLFPMEAKGAFYISELNSKFSRHLNVGAACRVHKWTEYDPTRVKGMMVKMVYGQAPQQECQFTGLIEFNHVSEEHTIIGCTMTTSPRLFEMAVTTEPFFIMSLNSHELENQPMLQKCLRFVQSECDSYMQSIKVKKDYDVDQAQSQV